MVDGTLALSHTRDERFVADLPVQCTVRHRAWVCGL